MSNDKQISRRDFVAGAVGLAVAAGASRVLAAAPPVRVAVIGTGGRGCELTRKLSTIPDVNLAAVCDDYEPHLKDGAKYAGPQAQTFTDYKVLLDRVRPQAVVVAVPLYLHHRVCVDAIAHGCDVFCEKTMAYSLDEARDLVAKVTAAKCVFQVGLQRRSNTIYQQAQAMVEAGMIGRITAIKSQWHRNNNWRRPVPVPRTDPRWTDLEHRLNWRLYRKYSHGLMTELGSHQMDVANWMLGTTPTRVMATGGIDYWRDGREVPDNVFCTYEYTVTPHDRDPSGTAPYTVRVTYSSLCNNAFEGASELIMGTRGTLLLTENKGLLYKERGPDDVGFIQNDAANHNASIVTSGKTLGLSNDPWAERGKPQEIDNPGGDPTRDQLVSFIDHVQQRDPNTVCDVHAGLIDAATALMATQAMDDSRLVAWPLTTGH